ncbi:LysR family transcriptional regulator [Roseicyclus sp. F158]|uniref:LysR family transcriptional regulator n=1 Tax=Tropicimonas omnivorans TaxID=3075590 RepID=A0ABU3DGI4_9RHOB|nr:LysR family transcriptional regulator [Roseicyclus sp. F158]MDT0682826.1 LysR family transcriptional regulator [Roseicyclus sp. F158]
MPRNLDMTALRSFVAVADSGGVTRAAGLLNLTQSAVSMQLKRLEEGLGLSLMDRSRRGIALTAEGDQLLAYARRMVSLNDEAIGRMTSQEFEGEVMLGVPHDIVYPFIPQVLQKFAAAYPRMRANLLSLYTRQLQDLYRRGQCGIILTTEQEIMEGGEVLSDTPLSWVGARGGQAWRRLPLRLAFARSCIFRSEVVDALDRAGIPWEMAVEAESERAIEATVSADLAITADLEGTAPPFLERIPHGGALPELRSYHINLYVSEVIRGKAELALADLVREAYRNPVTNPAVNTAQTDLLPVPENP